MLAYLVLKGFDIAETRKTLIARENIAAENFILRNAHFGGYGKQNKAIEDFIIQFYERHRILLDPIYLAKMFFQLWSDIRSGLIQPESTIIAIHTGGLQGLAGYNYRYGTDLPEWEIPDF